MATRFAQFVALTFLLAGWTTSAASAQNLIVNPNFATGIDNWQTVQGVTVTWDSTRDANGSPTSGSARGSWQGPSASGFIPVVSQCVEVTPGSAYTYGGKIFIPSGQAISGDAFFLAIGFPTHGCSGPPPPGPFIPTPAVTALDTWTGSTGPTFAFGPSIMVTAFMEASSGGSFQASFDDLVLVPPGSCIPDATTLCLLSNRFKVTATFDAGNGNAGQAKGIPVGDSGLFWFFNSTNIEMVVKVLDGCGLGGHYWFFAGGLTNVQVTLLVMDTQTGATRTYHNPLGTAFEPIQDTSAFNCSP